jgi:hypothetical protein
MNQKPIRLMKLHRKGLDKELEKQPDRIAEAQVQAGIEQLQGKYCNVAVIQHTKREFVFDYILRVGNNGVFVSRIITSPEHAKAIYDVLGKNIQQYENTFGKIDIDQQKPRSKESVQKRVKRNIRRRYRPLS